MDESGRLAALRREVESELQRDAEKWRNLGRESARETRIPLARWREHVRRRYFDAWLAETARKLGRSPDTVHLLGLVETHVLQDAGFEAAYLTQTDKLADFYREVPIEKQGDIERLLKKLGTQIADIPIYILRGIAGFWLLADQEEPGWSDVCANASSYFGAVKATIGEVLANAEVWLDKVISRITFISATDAFDRITLTVGRGPLVRDPSYDGLSCALTLHGQQWGRLLSDEQSDSNY